MPGECPCDVGTGSVFEQASPGTVAKRNRLVGVGGDVERGSVFRGMVFEGKTVSAGDDAKCSGKALRGW